MGKPTRPTATPHSPGPSGSQLSGRVPEIFRSRRAESLDRMSGNMAPASFSHATTQASQRDTDVQSSPSPALAASLHDLPTRAELSSVALDIKQTLSAALGELRKDIQTLGGRLMAVEEVSAKHSAMIQAVQAKQSATSRSLIEVRRHLEDLDNRGRRSNIRVRGVPESVLPDAIPAALTAIFNSLLGRPPDTHIDLVRAHRALRPRNMQTDVPRDIICCLSSFPLKEDILQRSRRQGPSLFEGFEIHLYQDLSVITLQQRRALRPLLGSLRAHEITYRWRFPFCLVASHKGISATVRLPEDIPEFCTRLSLPLVEVDDWYADLQSTTADVPTQAPVLSPPRRTGDPGKQRSPPRRMSPRRSRRCRSTSRNLHASAMRNHHSDGECEAT